MTGVSQQVLLLYSVSIATWRSKGWTLIQRTTFDRYCRHIALAWWYCAVIIWSNENPSCTLSWDSLLSSPLIDPVAIVCNAHTLERGLSSAVLYRLMNPTLWRQSNNKDLDVRWWSHFRLKLVIKMYRCEKKVSPCQERKGWNICL